MRWLAKCCQRETKLISFIAIHNSDNPAVLYAQVRVINPKIDIATPELVRSNKPSQAPLYKCYILSGNQYFAPHFGYLPPCSVFPRNVLCIKQRLFHPDWAPRTVHPRTVPNRTEHFRAESPPRSEFSSASRTESGSQCSRSTMFGSNSIRVEPNRYIPLTK